MPPIQVISFIAAILKKTGTHTDVMRQKPLFIRKVGNEHFHFSATLNGHRKQVESV